MVPEIIAIAPANKSSERYRYLMENERKTNISFLYMQQSVNTSKETVELMEFTQLSGGHSGCYESHLNSWKYVKANNISASVILEDDVELDLYFKSKLNSTLELLGHEWPDVLLIGHCYSTSVSPWLPVSEISHFACTHAYMVTYAGAKKLIRFLDKDPLRLNSPIDLAMSQLRKMGLITIKMVNKPFARQLPRSILSDAGVSGKEELPAQILDNPSILSNELYLQYINGQKQGLV